MKKHLNYTLFRKTLTLLLFGICIININAQEIHFERIPNDLGLSQNFISTLVQDHQGFIWVGTKDGLNRFDGYQFKTYLNDPFDSTSISKNHIKCIFEDSQNRLWIGTTNGLNLMDRKEETFQHLFSTSGNQKIFTLSYAPPGLIRNDISSIAEDQDGNIWIGTTEGEVRKLEISKTGKDFKSIGVEIFFPGENENELRPKPVKEIEVDHSGLIWIHTIDEVSVIEKNNATNEYKVRRIKWEEVDPENEMLRHPDFLFTYREKTKIDHRFHSFIKDKQGNIWIKTVAGFAKWLPDQKRFSNKHLNLDRKESFVFPLAGTGGKGLFDRNGHIWIQDQGALIIFDTLTHTIIDRYHRKNRLSMGLPKTGIRSILEDNNGNIWLGTSGMGLYKYNPNKQKFKDKPGVKLWKGESIRTIFQTKEGTLWLGANNTNLLEIPPGAKEGKLLVLDRKRWPRTYESEFAEVYAMKEDRFGNLWIGTSRGLVRLKRENGETLDWDFYKMYEDPKIDDGYNAILDIHLDKEGALWLITRAEFGRFDPEKNKFFAHNYLDANGGKLLNAAYPFIHQQKNEIFWLGTNEGLLRFDPLENNFQFFTSDPKNPKSLSQKLVKCIQPDPEKPEETLWIGTGGGGLNKFDLKTKTSTHFKKQDGLPDNVVYGILDDEEGNLWMSTNQGLSKFNPQTETFKNYSVESGLQDNEFNSRAFYKNEKGMLFFGGIRGYNAFDPNVIRADSFKAPIAFTNFKIANQSVDFKFGNTPLKHSISETESLVMSWKDNIFSFEFASLDFTNPNKNEYAYKLEGFDDQWQHIGNQRSTTFTNIDPGEYILKVKGTNHDGLWNEDGISLNIKILPPWWKTYWAYFAYVWGIGFLIFAWYKFNINRQLEKAEAFRLKEINVLKTRLYTNITHEFRTPLTVIMGMTDNIKGHKKEKNLIQRNSGNLMNLINQMLDLSKVESGHLKTVWIQSDIIFYLNYLKESFYSLAEEKEIQLSFESEISELVMDYDEIKIQHIINNLLSNALKFTPIGGMVKLHVQQQNILHQDVLVLQVIDNGIGISREQLPYVFDRFYQVDNSNTRIGEGTGIGLTLTKEMVKLMKGKIEVESDLGKGTKFTIQIPILKRKDTPQIGNSIQGLNPSKEQNKNETTEAFSNSNILSKTINETQDDRPILLIIEDNLDVIAYIKSILEKEYQIETANDGQAGIDKAVAIIPDIIISDVMMPLKDGYEVCETLKTDERTSHIPIIMLTAKATQQDRLTGLKTGADAYLMKPFNKEELFIRLERLIELRKVLQSRYLTKIDVQKDLSSDIQIQAKEPTLDDLFLQKILDVIHSKIEDSNLGITDLCNAVHLSQTQVFRKLKALTGLSPMRYVLKIRLHKAKKLLQSTALNVSEIAYDLGFTDPNYFSRAFSKEFGAPPSSLRK